MARTPVDREGHHGDPRNNRFAIVDRSQFFSQLFRPDGRPTPVMYAFAGRMQKEVGNQGPEAQMAWAETVFNRCASRNHTIDYELRNHGNYNYWPRHQPDPGHSTNPAFVDMITKVCRNGTNISLGATGNASENVGVGRETFRSRGERFGVEHGDSNWWRNKFSSLIRGVGKFIGDVASAIGNGIAAVGNAVVGAGRWMMNGIGSIFAPHNQHAPASAPPHGHPHTHPVRERQQPNVPSVNYTPQQPPERRVINVEVAQRKWVMHSISQSAPEPVATPDARGHTPPRPST